MNGVNYNMLASSFDSSGNVVMTITLTGALAHIMRNNIGYPNSTQNMTGVDTMFNTWDLNITPASSDFASISDPSVSMTGMQIEGMGALGPRQADGSLPNVDFMHLSATSRMIDKGTDVKLPYLGAAPDLGAYEYGATSTGGGSGTTGAGGSAGAGGTTTTGTGGAGGTASTGTGGSGAAGKVGSSGSGGGTGTGGATTGTGGTGTVATGGVSGGSGGTPGGSGGTPGGSGGTPGSGGVSGGSGGTPGGSGGASGTGSGGTSSGEAAAGGCGCAVDAPAGGASLFGVLGVLALVLVRARRRRPA
jgi:MYXO-CTERM domain-containing protein